MGRNDTLVHRCINQCRGTLLRVRFNINQSIYILRVTPYILGFQIHLEFFFLKDILFCHWFVADFQGVPSRTGSPRVLGIYSLAPFVMFTLLAYLETHNQYTLLCVVAVGKWDMKKLADDKEGRGQSKAYNLMHYCYFSDWSRQRRTLLWRFEFSRAGNASRRLL